MAEKWDFWRGYLGDGAYEILKERARMNFYYRQKDWKEITAHYREQEKAIKAQRAMGMQGPIPLLSYD